MPKHGRLHRFIQEFSNGRCLQLYLRSLEQVLGGFQYICGAEQRAQQVFGDTTDSRATIKGSLSSNKLQRLEEFHRLADIEFMNVSETTQDSVYRGRRLCPIAPALFGQSRSEPGVTFT